jgi:hypothetical protein
VEYQPKLAPYALNHTITKDPIYGLFILNKIVGCLCVLGVDPLATGINLKDTLIRRKLKRVSQEMVRVIIFFKGVMIILIHLGFLIGP